MPGGFLSPTSMTFMARRMCPSARRDSSRSMTLYTTPKVPRPMRLSTKYRPRTMHPMREGLEPRAGRQFGGAAKAMARLSEGYQENGTMQSVVYITGVYPWRHASVEWTSSVGIEGGSSGFGCDRSFTGPRQSSKRRHSEHCLSSLGH